MKAKRIAPVMRGLSAVMASVLALSVVGTGIAEGYRSALDGFLGTSSYVTITDEDSARFQSDYATIDEMKAAARDIAIREGEEGTVIMKNDNDVLPLASDTTVALFGLAAYAPYPYTSGDHKAGNADAVDLVQALTDAGVQLNQTVLDFYQTNILNTHTEQVPNQWTGELETSTAYDHIYVASPGDMTTYQIYEVPPTEYVALGAPAKQASNWIMGEVLRALSARGMEAKDMPLSPATLSRLIAMVAAGRLNRNTAVKVFEAIFETDGGVDEYVKAHGLEQVSDAGLVAQVVDEVLDANEKSVADYRAGKEKAFGFLVGQVMRQLKGQASPAVVNQVLRERLTEE